MLNATCTHIPTPGLWIKSWCHWEVVGPLGDRLYVGRGSLLMGSALLKEIVKPWPPPLVS